MGETRNPVSYPPCPTSQCWIRSRAKLVLVVRFAAIYGDLSPDFATGKSRGVHVCIGGAGSERAEEAGEVMGVQRLVVGGGVQRNDVARVRRSSDHTGRTLRAIGFLRDGRIPLRAAAEKRHHGIVAAFQTKVN